MTVAFAAVTAVRAMAAGTAKPVTTSLQTRSAPLPTLATIVMACASWIRIVKVCAVVRKSTIHAMSVVATVPLVLKISAATELSTVTELVTDQPLSTSVMFVAETVLPVA